MSGPWDGHYLHPCVIAQAIGAAELAWRRQLAAQTVAGIKAAVERDFPDAPERTRRWLVNAQA